MSQTFERIVDRKDAIISSLAKDLEEAEQQYQVALRSNLYKVDDLLGKCWAVSTGLNSSTGHNLVTRLSLLCGGEKR